MARTKKKPRRRPTLDLQIPVTARQQQMILKAARISAADLAAWVRPIIIQAAKDALAEKELARVTPPNAELRKLAKRFPPPPRWFDEEEKPPF
jgi:uncharacterized protein (DUF1778 family)